MNFLIVITAKVFCFLLFFNLLKTCEVERTETGTGQVNLSVLEPAKEDENISGIYISIKRIELKGPEGWITYKQFENSLNLNLLDNETNKSYFLGEKLLPAGHYQEARLILDSQNKEHTDLSVTSECYLQYINGEIKPVYLPNSSKDGIVAKGEFNLPAEGVVNITLNFDIREGLKKFNEPGTFLLKPIIKMLVNNDSGIIEGQLEESSHYNKVVVFAYSSNDLSNTEIFNPAKQESRIEKSSSSSILNEEGKFILSFLKKGKYDLYFYAYDQDGNYNEMIGKLGDIEIERGQKTIINVPKGILTD